MSGRKLLDDCFLHDRDRLRHDEVIALITGRLATVTASEHLPLLACQGRFLAANIAAPLDVPRHDNAAVDGYAFDSSAARTGSFAIGPRIAAGDLGDIALQPGEAARIFTGARMPVNADTVAMQEDCESDEAARSVTIPVGLKPGANRRRAGEDCRAGETVLRAGQRLRPQDIARAASLGLDRLPVNRPVRIGLISTGNELKQPGDIAPEHLPSGAVFDSNRAMLAGLASTLPVTVTDYGTLPDSAATITRMIRGAASENDLLLSTGGASRGDEDHIVTALDTLGKRHLWQIAVKPGRPMTFGQIGDCVFMGLPGNPVAAFVCFLLYCRPVLTLLGGGSWREPTRFPVPAGFSIPRKKADRREFWRGWLETNASGQIVGQKFARDGSGLISGLVAATGLIEASEHTTAVAEGDLVSFIPFSELGLSP